MRIRVFLFSAALLLGVASLQAAALFPQCPPVGNNTGCQFLITIGANNAVTVAADPNPPNNGPYDGVEDTLVGVLNASTGVVASLPLSSTTDIFGFDGDGPCTQSPKPASCPASGLFSPDTSGYAGPNVTFSGINPANTSGTVNFTGGLAPGQSRWFALEESLTASQIVPGTPNPGGSVPEPATLLMLGGGLLALPALSRRRRAAR
ncbi:MAG: PEP-CTERM sorting domain-containing protein [Acidobacteriia bacterium]|nr:PEP-CTERM sorting domain-containing protein [Terriglobia bacterium]